MLVEQQGNDSGEVPILSVKQEEFRLGKTIKSVQDLYDMLDADFRSAKQFWEPFYENRDRPIPFFQTSQTRIWLLM